MVFVNDNAMAPNSALVVPHCWVRKIKNCQIEHEIQKQCLYKTIYSSNYWSLNRQKYCSAVDTEMYLYCNLFFSYWTFRTKHIRYRFVAYHSNPNISTCARQDKKKNQNQQQQNKLEIFRILWNLLHNSNRSTVRSTIGAMAKFRAKIIVWH